MNAPRRLLWKCVRAASACMVAFMLLMSSVAQASPKILDAETVRNKIVKRGVGNWACVEERSGLALCGRITSIDDNSFGLQLHNYPEVTDVMYGEVIQLHLGLSGKGIALIIGGTVAVGLTAGLVMHHEYEVNKPTLPTTPGLPAFP
jgi:hypothetical protein